MIFAYSSLHLKLDFFQNFFSDLSFYITVHLHLQVISCYNTEIPVSISFDSISLSVESLNIIRNKHITKDIDNTIRRYFKKKVWTTRPIHNMAWIRYMNKSEQFENICTEQNYASITIFKVFSKRTTIKFCMETV